MTTANTNTMTSTIPINSSINANHTRVDFLDLSHWGYAVMKDIDHDHDHDHDTNHDKPLQCAQCVRAIA